MRGKFIDTTVVAAILAGVSKAQSVQEQHAKITDHLFIWQKELQDVRHAELLSRKNRMLFEREDIY
jgi:hypothetical protein